MKKKRQSRDGFTGHALAHDLSPYLDPLGLLPPVGVASYPPGPALAGERLRWGYDPVASVRQQPDRGILGLRLAMPTIETVAPLGLPGAHATWALFGVPGGIRTRVLTLRGWRPGPG